MTESSTTERAPPDEPKLQCSSSDYQPLVPLRVDVSVAGTNKASPSTPSLRIVETILLDPYVWPLRPRKPHDEVSWIEDNARFLAHNILTDLEVQGMGRTVRHFTNRAEIWSIEMQKRVMDQLRPQLQVVAGMRRKKQQRTHSKKRSSVAKMVHLPVEKKKRKTLHAADSDAPMDDDAEVSKRKDEMKGEVEDAKDEKMADVAASSSTNASENQTKTDRQNKPDHQKSSHSREDPSPFSHLIPVKIRLSVHGVRIHDDCLWDPSLSSSVTPLDYARILAHDLKLSAEAVQAIAVDITEQIYGSARNGDVPEKVEIADEDSPVKASTSTTAAWGLDSKTHISHVAHLVAQHRQP